MSRSHGWKRLFRLGHSRRRVEEEVEDELRFHMEGLVDRHMARGMSEHEAWRRVRKRWDASMIPKQSCLQSPGKPGAGPIEENGWKTLSRTSG